MRLKIFHAENFLDMKILYSKIFGVKYSPTTTSPLHLAAYKSWNSPIVESQTSYLPLSQA